jgi:hypothetical protein
MKTGLLAGGLLAAAVLLWPRRSAPLSRLQARPGRVLRHGKAPGDVAVPPTVVIELVAAALVAGLPGPDAVAAAARACGPATDTVLAGPVGSWRLGVPAAQAWAGVAPEFQALARSLVLAERTGASAAVVLRRAATDSRAARQRRARVRARRLGVQLVLPLGLTTLPAFALLGVAPVVLGLAAQLLDAP